MNIYFLKRRFKKKLKKKTTRLCVLETFFIFFLPLAAVIARSRSGLGLATASDHELHFLRQFLFFAARRDRLPFHLEL